jgi:hypothetical protein
MTTPWPCTPRCAAHRLARPRSSVTQPERVPRRGPARPLAEWPPLCPRVPRRPVGALPAPLEFPDPLARRDQLCFLHRRQPRPQPTIDAVLAAPRVDRLAADPQILGHLGDIAPSLDQIEHTTPKRRRIAPSPHAVLLQDSSITFQLPDSTKAPAHQSLYETRGGSAPVLRRAGVVIAISVAASRRRPRVPAVQLRATPTEHRPSHPPPTRPALPRHRPATRRKAHRLAQPLEPYPLAL